MAPIELAIPSVSTTSDAANPRKQYTVYGISVRQPLRSYTLQKRYSDFVALHDALTAQASAAPPQPLPPKTWLKSTTTHPDLAEERRQGLETYLRAINDAADTRWRSCTAWKTFLNLPAGTNHSKGASSSSSSFPASAGRIAGPAATITDPSVWLDVHRDLKSQLRDARQALTRREHATAAQAQHEAAADVKSCLVRANAMMAALDGGLQNLGGEPAARKSNGANNQGDEGRSAPKLGEGELRRRKDLLASAKKERDHVDELLRAQVSRQQQRDGAVEASAADTTTLFSGARPAAGRSGRVLGAAKETEETRPLDNEGVLQLQQRKMQEQDEDVTVLTGTVQRLREMGVQVNNELQLQNDMLDMLDKDATRVGDKVNVAKKRIGKIS